MITPTDLLLKAKNCIRMHARCVHKYAAGRRVSPDRWSDALTIEQFSERHGWHAERMARDVEAAMMQGCAYCGAAYASPAKVTFDVIDQTIAWDYATNVVLCCDRCNGSKSYRSVAQWIARKPILSWAVDDRRRRFASGDHLVEQLSLFDPRSRRTPRRGKTECS